MLRLLLVLTLLAAGVVASSAGPAPPPAPPQFATASYARCLGGAKPSAFSLSADVVDDGLAAFDLLLVWLSVYAGDRYAGVNTTLQQPAYERWSVPLWATEAAFADALVALANASEPNSVTPGMTYAAAVAACAAHPPFAHSDPSRPDAFCAALVSHNVLRLLGRYKLNTDRNGIDYSPPWFVANKAVWVTARIPAIHAALIVLRRDTVTEKWGTWYHTHGLLAYGLQEMGVLGVDAGTAWEEMVVALDTLLNPILAGGFEDPVKAREDAESVHVAAQFVALMTDPAPPPYNATLCASKAGYIIAPWAPTPTRRR